jgi:hypothetical protein
MGKLENEIAMVMTHFHLKAKYSNKDLHLADVGLYI